MQCTSEWNDRLEKTVQDYRESILRFAFAYLKNRFDAEDIAQEVFVAYITSEPYCNSEAEKRSWLLKVTANKCINLIKSTWKKRVVELSDDLSYLPKEDATMLSSILALDEKYRVPIHLYYFEGYSTNEIAKILRLNPATLRTHLTRARILLKEILGDE
jgi:RNA polymerase sigma factor (sigma-70 family)